MILPRGCRYTFPYKVLLRYIKYFLADFLEFCQSFSRWIFHQRCPYYLQFMKESNMLKSLVRKSSMSLYVAVALTGLIAGCGGGQDPILGAKVTGPLVVPVGAITPPAAIVPASAPASVAPAPVVLAPAPAPVTAGLTCPTTGPALQSTNPSNGDLAAPTSTTGVSGNGKLVTANFSGTMDASGITASTFQLAQAGSPAETPASVGYDTTTKVASLTTTGGLKTNTDYLAVIKVPASSVPGADPGCVYAWSWTFKTAATPAASPPFVDLGAADPFAIAATAGVSNTGATIINGDTVLNPNDTCNAVPVGGSGTFGLCGGAAPVAKGTVVTPTFPNTTLAQQVTDALRAAYLKLTPPSGPPAAGSLGGGMALATTSIGAPTGSPMVSGQNFFAPGVYKSGSVITIAGDVTLDGGGDANSVFVFQAGSSITATPGAPTPAAHARILLQNGAKASNVFWQAGASTTLGNYAEWNGNVLTGANLTMQTGASSCGRLFAGAFTTGAFVFDSNIVSVPGKASSPPGCL